MKAKTLATLAAITVLAAVAAGVSVVVQPGSKTTESAGQKVFPGLLETVNDVRRIVVQSAKGKLTIEQGKEGWTLAERNGYPVPVEKVRGVLLDLARLEQLEAKTRHKERYAELDLQDPETADAKSKKLVLYDGSNSVIAALIVGKRVYGLGADSGGGVYVRKPDDSQTWLAKGELDVGDEPRDWLDREIIDLPAKRIARVAIAHPDGETLVVSKASPDSAHFTVEDLPAAAKLKGQFEVDTIASVLTDLQLDDVRKADDIVFSDETTVHTNVRTFDGLLVDIALDTVDGKKWARLNVGAEPAAGQGGAEGDVENEADTIMGRLAGWAYRIPAYKSSRLTKRMSDLIKEPVPES